MTRIVTVRGTGEDYGTNMLSGVVAGVENVTELVFRPEIRPIGMLTYQQSVAAGRAALRRLDAEGEPYILVGFSLGAAIVGDFVAHDRPQHCVGVIVLADPLRHRGQPHIGGAPRDRAGVAGERLIPGVVHTFTLADDPISACPVDNGLRLIAVAVTGRPQGQPARWWDAWGTITWLRKYLADGRHVAYGVERLPDGRTFIRAARDALMSML